MAAATPHPDSDEPGLSESVFGLHMGWDMAEALRDRSERRDGNPRIGPRPTSPAELDTLEELRKSRRAEPMVDLMDRSIPTAEEEAARIEPDIEEGDEVDPPALGDEKVVPISTARSGRRSTPPPEPDEAPGALPA